MNQWLTLRNRGTGSNLVDVGRAAADASRTNGEATPALGSDAGVGGWEESLRRTHRRAVGEELGAAPTNRRTGNMGTLWCLPFQVRSQRSGGQGRRRLMGATGGGAVVVVRVWESHIHGEGRQRVRSFGSVRPGGRR